MNRPQRFLDAKVNDQLGRTGKVRIIVLKGRKQGVSTYTEARMFWRVMFGEGRRGVVLTHLQEASDTLFGMTKRYLDHLPPALRPSTGASNAKEVFFDKLDSGLEVATAGSRGTGRSATFQYFHGSEVAFWPNAADHMQGLGQAIPSELGTEAILESTANGLGNAFHRMWVTAESGQSEWEAVFIPWHWSEEYSRDPGPDFKLTEEEDAYRRAHRLSMEQMAWRRAKIEGDFLGEVERFAQEFPATAEEAFVAVGHDPWIAPILVLKAVAGGTSPMTATGPLVIGVDPARMGADKTAIIRRRGRVVDKNIERIEKRDTMHVAGRLALIIREEKPVKMFIDVGGLGVGVYDRLVELGFGHIVVAVNFGESANNETAYRNRRAEMWGEMKRWFVEGPVSVPNDAGLIGDLSAPSYRFDSNGRLLLESKEDMAKRGVKSPDAGDALALTFAMPVSALFQAAIQPTFAEALAELGMDDETSACPWLQTG